jgi:hypothetical protein
MQPHTTTAPRRQASPPRHLGALRVTGSLTADAQLQLALGQPPHMHLVLALQPQEGLPYIARVDLGADAADHMGAEALLPQMRRGAVLSVAAQALELRTDHGHAALRLVQPHSVLILEGPIGTAAAAPAPLVQPQLQEG